MRKELLPIGTVVLLEGGNRKVMITGYSSKNNDEEKIYDYNGCIFPEGLIENIFCLFDNNQIIEVIYKGLENEEFKEFIEKEASKISLVTSSNNLKQDNNLGLKNRSKSPNSVDTLSSNDMYSKFAAEKISGNEIEKIDSINL